MNTTPRTKNARARRTPARSALLALALLCVPAFTALVALAPPAGAAGNAYATPVPSDGTVVTVHVAPDQYTITVSGTYFYADIANPPGYADAAYSWGDPDHPSCYDWPGNDHDLLVDGASPWQAPCNESHVYSTGYACSASAGCDIDFQIQDEQTWDNNGTLQVTIAPATREVCAPTPPSPPAVVLCYDYQPGEPVLAPTLTEVALGGDTHHVVGYVDTYRFALPDGVATTAPCVTLLVDGAPVDPCAAAGGVFVGHFQALVDQTVGQPIQGPVIGTVAICEAQMTLTVDGFGVEGAPVLIVC